MWVALYSTNPNIYRFRKHAKGRGLGLDGLLSSSTFRVRQISSVEAEDELVEIIIEIFVDGASLEGAKHPSLHRAVIPFA